MRILKVLFIVFVLFLHAFAQADDISLELKSKIPLGGQSRLFLPKKEQVLIFKENSTEVWSIETGKLLKTLPPMNPRYISKELSPDETKFIAYGFLGKEAELWDAERGRLIAAMPKQKKDISRIEWSSDSLHFILESSPYEPQKEHFVWNAATGQVKSNFKTKYESVAQLSPNGKTVLTREKFITFRKNDLLKLWDAASGNFIRELFLPVKNQAVSAFFTPDSQRIIARGHGGLYVFDAGSGEIKYTIEGEDYSGNLSSFRFSPNGKLLLLDRAKFRGLTKEDETWFEIYNLETGKLKTELRTAKNGKHQVETHQIVWRPDGQAIISAGEYYNRFKNYEAESWSVSDGGSKFVLSPLVAKLEPSPFESGYKKYDDISYTPDSRFLITQNPEFIRVWSAETGKLLKKFDSAEGRFFFTKDNKYLGEIDKKEAAISFYKLTGK